MTTGDSQGLPAERSPLPRDGLLLVVSCGFLFFFGLAYFGLVGADEPRYAQVAREMLSRHDWILPTLAGKPWLEKPVLYYWQAMLAYRIFGVSDWAARFPSAADATLLVAVVYLFLRRFRPGFELDGALMTASTAGMIGFARAAATDMPLTAMFGIALLAWYGWYATERKRWLGAFYVFLALGTLAKGPVAPALALVIIVVFAAAKGEMRWVRGTLWVPGVLLFCLVALPWFVAVQWREPEFFRVFILQHNLARFGTNLYRHAQPFWYYAPVLLFGLVPWVILVTAAAGECVRMWWRAGREFLRSDDAFNAFLLIWLLVPLVFFSVSQSKLPGYIVPALPAGVLLLAEYARRHIQNDERPHFGLIALHCVTAALPLLPALMIQYVIRHHRLPWGQATAIGGAIALAVASGIALTLRSRLGLRALRFATLVPVVLVVALVLRAGAPALDATLSARPLANEISRVEEHRLPLAVLGVSRELEYGLQFYRDQNISRYELGQIPEGQHIVVTPERFREPLERWAAGRRVSYLGGFAPQRAEYYWVAGLETRKVGSAK
jgi:4-amino-4-deoxy-L-arabinose transferase-like glycosyltransferase